MQLPLLLDYGVIICINVLSQSLNVLKITLTRNIVYDSALKFITGLSSRTNHHLCLLFAQVKWTDLFTCRLRHWYSFIHKRMLGLHLKHAGKELCRTRVAEGGQGGPFSNRWEVGKEVWDHRSGQGAGESPEILSLGLRWIQLEKQPLPPEWSGKKGYWVNNDELVEEPVFLGL